jgi:hypothetical protein
VLCEAMDLRCTLGALACVLVCAVGATSASAEPPPRAVVELFTSQGCSSCPPADRTLVELARNPQLIALTLPVDYWDYLGWKDTLAHPAFSARQRAYAAARNDRQVYTPQMVMNGTVRCIGSDRAKVEASIAKASAGPQLPVAVRAREGDGYVTVEVGEAEDVTAGTSAEVLLMPVARSRDIAIVRGENRGRTMTYANVVRALHRVGIWRGQAARFDVPLATARSAEADGYVVILQADQHGKPGAILGAFKSAGL